MNGALDCPWPTSRAQRDAFQPEKVTFVELEGSRKTVRTFLVSVGAGPRFLLACLLSPARSYCEK